ncbi:MAG: hypothetical protein CMH48_09555 [Muricauda sp.]|nr:DUF2268 domain-containing putative Zn-dependent protease [Allomuricauda sp.]MAU26494.1 hypothetical protein [Allomuricauda sp.]MBC31080.1 hypothetical protein [Allomuricauda sp.]
MKSFLVFLTLCIALKVSAQETGFSTDPLDAKFVTSDVDLFWEAFEKVDAATENPFEAYLEKGSPGVQGFIEYRIVNADSLLEMVKKRKDDYLASKGVLADLESRKKRVQAIYAAMKYWYPDTVFPPIYFVYGRFNTGGTVSDDGLILGVEMMKNLDGLAGLVAHELIHYQQKFSIPEADFNLLANVLFEGSADFLGELISGDSVESLPHYQYGDKHFQQLALEFVLSLDNETNVDWLYGTTGKDDRPNDLGYWMGYHITKAYFEKADDKKQAIHDILHIGDAKSFLIKSGFLDSQLAQAKKMTDAEKEAFLRSLHKKD